MFGFRSRNTKREEDPADYVFRAGYSPHGSFLFEDGTSMMSSEDSLIFGKRSGYFPGQKSRSSMF